MTENFSQPIDALAQAVVDDATHYVGSVADMATHNEVIAAEDIVSASGVKLAARGTRIDASLREKLCAHRLSGGTLEQSLVVVGGVSPKSLAIDIGRLIDEDAWFARLVAKSDNPGTMRHAAAYLELPQEILFRLTVAREQRPDLYRHLLGVAIISHYLAVRSNLKEAAVNSMLIAALCHDLGELYIDPAILGSGHRVTDEERRFIYVHPIAGWLMVHGLSGVNADVASAVIQHQERLDGSGYPYGRKSEAIGLPGRILAAADVSASIMLRFGNHRRLSTLLRLNGKKYDTKIVNLLHGAIVADAPAAGNLAPHLMTKRFADFAAVLNGWGHLRASAELAQNVFIELLSERMFNLRMVVVQCGFDPDSLEMPLKLANEDPTIAAELTAVVDELQFQLADLGREFDRRAADLMETFDPLAVAILTDWRRQLQECITG